MATFRSSSLVEKQLEHARRLLPADFKEPSRGDDFVGRLQWRSIQNHIRALEAELEESVAFEMGKSDFQFSVDGGPVREHSVSAGFLADLLRKSQELVESLAAFVIPRSTNETQLALMVDGSFQSSFGLKFHLGKGERTVECVEEGEKIADAFCRLFDGDADKKDLEGLLKHPEVRNNYFSIIRVISKSGARIVVRTQAYKLGTRLNSFQANQRLEWVNEPRNSERELFPDGTLVGGGLKRGTFEIEGDDGIFYSGKMSPDAREQIKKIKFGQAVTTWIVERKEFKEGDLADPKIKYTLLGVDPKEDDEKPTPGEVGSM